MALLQRLQHTDREAEKRLLTGLIVSDKILSNLRTFIQPEIFELEVGKLVSQWIISYYDTYKQSPKKHIKDIYEVEKGKIKRGLDDEVSQFLTKLSEDYLSDGGPEGINEDFIIDKGRQYLKERNLRKIATDINSLLDIGRVDEAEKKYEESKKVIQEVSYRWTAPFDDPQFINSVFEESETPLFRMKGQLGSLVGDLRRGWLFVLMGPMKRGKTWGLQDIAFDAMFSRKRVAYISLEMKDRHLAPRMYKQLGAFGDESGDYIFPCFDCCNNQDNSCNKHIRENKAKFPGCFDPHKKTQYKPCTACRKIESEKKDFLPTVWHFIADRPKLSLPNTRKELKKFQRTFGKNLLRLISFPAFSATMKDVDEQLNELERDEGFIPDVIITDYGGIMAPEHYYGDPRHNIDDIFKAHKRMAGERSALVVSGVQSLGMGRSALNKDMQDETDIGANAYILAHVDILMALDQNVEEKESGVWRMGILEHRWKKFNKRRQAMVLQQLELGMPSIDSEIIYWSGGKKAEDE